MPTVHAFHVVPDLPKALVGLHAVAYNLRWAWNHDAIELFRRLDRNLWEQSGHNPVRMLGSIAQEKLREAAQDETFLAHLDRVIRSNETYLKPTNSYFQRTFPGKTGADIHIAYFSMEFGLTECLPIYSGGLGCAGRRPPEIVQ
jgi:starch phosphorylase